nr:NADH:ubiquinone/plastoquinone oxidoreductase [Tanacetum cinerariifolium]
GTIAWGLRILLPPQGWLIVRSRLEDPWFWKAHESERYVECATDTRKNLLREERSTLRKGASGKSIKSLLIRYELRALRHSGMLITSLYDSGMTFKTLCSLNYALMIRHDYDITSSLRRGALQLWYQSQMVNTRTDADLSTAVQNALQTFLPKIRAKIREEFRTSSGPSDASGNPPPSHVRQLNAPRGAAKELRDLLEHRIELLPPKKRGRNPSSSSTSALPQEFEIEESSHKTSLERHEEQIEEILNLSTALKT